MHEGRIVTGGNAAIVSPVILQLTKNVEFSSASWVRVRICFPPPPPHFAHEILHGKKNIATDSAADCWVIHTQCRICLLTWTNHWNRNVRLRTEMIPNKQRSSVSSTAIQRTKCSDLPTLKLIIMDDHKNSLLMWEFFGSGFAPSHTRMPPSFFSLGFCSHFNWVLRSWKLMFTNCWKR